MRLQLDAAYDRAAILDAAARSRAREKRTRAVELYRWVLAVEPQNVELHAKLAPLLAQTGDLFDAWCSFRSVARTYLRAGHAEKALAVYKDATLYLPRESEAWLAVARLQYKAGDSRHAVETLLEGSRNFNTRWLRPQAIHLLRRAREVDEWNFEVVSELAQLLALHDQRREAQLLLDGLSPRSDGDRLRRVRALQLRVSPTPKGVWRWLSHTFRRRPPADRLYRDAVEPQHGSSAELPESSSGERNSSSVVQLRAARGASR
jgi:thioredoxin-like negative regulator of GroEL